MEIRHWPGPVTGVVTSPANFWSYAYVLPDLVKAHFVAVEMPEVGQICIRGRTFFRWDQ